MKSHLTLDQAKRELLAYVHQAVSVLPPEASLELTGPSPDNPMLCDDSYDADPAGPQYVSAGFGIRGLDPQRYPHYFDLIVSYWRNHGWVIQADDRQHENDFFVSADSPDGYGLALQSNPRGNLIIKGDSPCAMVTAPASDGSAGGAASRGEPISPDSAPQVPLRQFRPADLTIDQARQRLLAFIRQAAAALPAGARVVDTGPGTFESMLCDESPDADLAGPRYVSAGFEVHGLDLARYPQYFDLVNARLRETGWIIRTDDPRPSGYRFLDAEHPDGYGLALQSNSVGELFIGGDTPAIPAAPE